MNNKKKTKNNRNRHQPFTLAQKVILGVIAIASITVIVASISIVFLKDQNRTEALINRMATDYYENYFYPNFSSSKGFKSIKDLDSAMAKYREYGFSPVKLRQLLLYDNRKNDQYRKDVTKYCDEEATSVKFYIDPPYEKNSYHYDITYSCNY